MTSGGAPTGCVGRDVGCCPALDAVSRTASLTPLFRCIGHAASVRALAVASGSLGDSAWAGRSVLLSAGYDGVIASWALPGRDAITAASESLSGAPGGQDPSAGMQSQYCSGFVQTGHRWVSAITVVGPMPSLAEPAVSPSGSARVCDAGVLVLSGGDDGQVMSWRLAPDGSLTPWPLAELSAGSPISPGAGAGGPLIGRATSPELTSSSSSSSSSSSVAAAVSAAAAAAAAPTAKRRACHPPQPSNVVGSFGSMVMGLGFINDRGDVMVMATCLGPDAGVGLARLRLTSTGPTMAEPPLVEPECLLGAWAEGSDFDSRSEV